VTARAAFDAASGTLRIDVEQRTPPTAGQQEKAPLHIPLRVALLGRDGRHLPGRLGEAAEAREWVLELTSAAQSFHLSGLAEAPAALSWLRGFSAPVLLDAGQGTAELAHLVAFDDDAFVRWDAAQSLLRRAVIARVGGAADTALETTLTDAMAALLDDASVEPVLLAALLELPAHRELMEWFEQVDPVAVHAARRQTERAVFAPIAETLQRCQPALESVDNGEFTAAAMGRRRLLNQILGMRVALEAEGAVEAAARQYREAQSQTLRMGALGALNDAEHPLRDELLEDFERRYHDDPLVLDKWFALQAGSQVPGGLERLERLLDHPGFRWSNPNRVRAVLGPFMAANHRHFHREDGVGYRRIGAFIERLDGLNPQTAARLVQPLTRWRRMDPARGLQMRAELERLAGLEGLSRDLTDMVQRALAPGQEG
jgi:aminopeptidase N